MEPVLHPMVAAPPEDKRNENIHPLLLVKQKCRNR